MSATSAIQTFINATKKTLASIATQITGLSTRLTKAEGRLTKAEADIKMLIAQTSSGAAAPPGVAPDPCVYIVSSAYASLPSPGNRVGPSDATNMPKIATSSGSAIQTSSSAHHYRFVGIEVKPSAGQFITNLISIGSGESSLATLPNNITFDRCYIHGDSSVGGRRGIALNGASCAVIDSYVSDFKEVGADNQAIWSYNSPGPLKIVNNHLEAACENVMFGGADPAITNLVPSDIEMRRNRFYKPVAWMSESWSVKNLLEFKNAQRTLVEGNVFENIWFAAQIGAMINAKSSGNASNSPWTVTQDLTVRYNRGLNLENGLQFSSIPDGQALAPTRWMIEHNVLEVTRPNGGNGWVFFIGGNSSGTISYLTMRHNTGLILVAGGTATFVDQGGQKGDQFDFRDNLLSGGDLGFKGSGFSEGTATLNGCFTNYTFTKNVLIGSTGTYPANNFFPANPAAVGFVNYAGGDYTLTGGSAYHNAASDGTDIGANISTVNSLTLHSSDGQWGSEPATYSGSGTVAEIPRTFLNTTYTPQAGATILVHSGGNLQTAINNANLGDTIIVDAGATFTGNFSLPAK